MTKKIKKPAEKRKHVFWGKVKKGDSYLPFMNINEKATDGSMANIIILFTVLFPCFLSLHHFCLS